MLEGHANKWPVDVDLTTSFLFYSVSLCFVLGFHSRHVDTKYTIRNIAAAAAMVISLQKAHALVATHIIASRETMSHNI